MYIVYYDGYYDTHKPLGIFDKLDTSILKYNFAIKSIDQYTNKIIITMLINNDIKNQKIIVSRINPFSIDNYNINRHKITRRITS